MGVMLVYSTPAFFVDSSQIWLYRSRRERCLTTLAGFWVELTTCVIATAIWTGTASGTAVHDLAYKYILVAGIMPVLFNMNPLMRLDGYIFFCEFFGTPNLREKSTAFLTAWMRHTIFRMPIQAPTLPTRRAWFYGFYAFFAGAYSYFVMLFFARVAYRVCSRITPEWAWVPATFIALKIFRSRIEKFMEFLKALYLDKKELVKRNPAHTAAVVAACLILGLIPFWRESEVAPIVIEPLSEAVVRAKVPGRVVQVSAAEGMRVRAGDVIAQLAGVDVESDAARARMELATANHAAFDAQIRYTDTGSTTAAQRRGVTVARVRGERAGELTLRSPIAGTVVTPRIQDLEESWVAPGTTIATVQDLSGLRARVFVAEPDMRTLGEISSVAIKLPSRVLPVTGKLESVSPTAQPVDPDLVPPEKFRGTAPPPYYVALVSVADPDATIRPGQRGEAKIFGERRSLLGMVARPARDFVLRKFW